MEEEDNKQKLKLLEDLKKSTADLQTKPMPIYAYTNLSAIKTFLQLESQLRTFLRADPSLFNLSHFLSDLKTQLNKLQNFQDYGLRSFIRRQITNYEISQIAAAVQAEVRSWVDQETVKNLVHVLQESVVDEEKKVDALIRFETRVSNGFDRDFQEMVLRAKAFSILESVVASKSKCSDRVWEETARAVVALVRFNKDVFVGEVLMGPMTRNMVLTSSKASIRALSSLIKLIRTPLVSEMEANGHIPKIIKFLSSKDLSIQVEALECVFELAYFGRKEAIETMLQEGLIEKLVQLQRLEIDDNSVEMGESGNGENRASSREGELERETADEARIIMEETPLTSCVKLWRFEIEDDSVGMGGLGEGENRGTCGQTELERETEAEARRLMEETPFPSCVTRFVVQLEMGEALEQGEKRQLKKEILRRAREASVSEAEATAIVAEVLWGSSPLLH